MSSSRRGGPRVIERVAPPWRKQGNLTRVFPGGFKPKATEPDLSSPLGYALRYAALGWHVVALHHIEDGKCSCGRQDCAAGKHPRFAQDILAHGLKDATTDEAIIRTWWARWPAANIGIVCGPVSGIFAIDVDPRNGGEASLDTLQAQIGTLPDTVEAMTGGGGRHIVFRYPREQFVRSRAHVLGPGLDVKASGGYIVVEPSSHLSGTAYTWEASSDPLQGVTVADAPAGLLERLVDREPETPAAGGYVVPLNELEVRSALSVLDPDEYETWIEIGQALHSTNDPRAFAWWDEWSQRSTKYVSGETPRKWAGFKADGGVSHRSLFMRAKTLGWQEPARAAAPVVPPAVRLSTVAELLARPRPTWTVDEVIPEHGLGLIYGVPGAGKTFLALDLSFAIARGLPWFGRRVKQGQVVYVAAEGRLTDRIAVYLRHHQLEPGQVEKLRIVEHGLNLLQPSAAEALSAAIAAELNGDVRLLVFDTLNRSMPGADENASEAMSGVIDAVAKITRQHGCTAIFVHHPGKDAARGARGHSSLLGALDFELQAQRTGEHRQVHVSKERDAEDDYPLGAFRLTYIALGFKTDYDPDATDSETYGSCVIEPAEIQTPTEQSTQQPTRPPKFPALAYEQLKRALSDKDTRKTLPLDIRSRCERPPRDGQWVCHLDHWRHCIQLVGGLSDGKSPSAERQAFGRAKTTLQDGGYIEICDDFVWLRTEDEPVDNPVDRRDKT